MASRPAARNPFARNPLVALFLVHGAIGFAAAAVFVAGLILANPNELGVLLKATPLAAVLLWFASGLTFAGVQTSAAVMALAEPE